jgi:hypothetical protein
MANICHENLVRLYFLIISCPVYPLMPMHMVTNLTVDLKEDIHPRAIIQRAPRAPGIIQDNTKKLLFYITEILFFKKFREQCANSIPQFSSLNKAQWHKLRSISMAEEGQVIPIYPAII